MESRSSTVVRPRVASCSARFGPTAFTNCTGVLSASNLRLHRPARGAIRQRRRHGCRRGALEIGHEIAQALQRLGRRRVGGSGAGSGPPSSPSSRPRTSSSVASVWASAVSATLRASLSRARETAARAHEPRRCRHEIVERRRQRPEQIFERRHGVIEPDARRFYPRPTRVGKGVDARRGRVTLARCSAAEASGNERCY